MMEAERGNLTGDVKPSPDLGHGTPSDEAKLSSGSGSGTSPNEDPGSMRWELIKRSQPGSGGNWNHGSAERASTKTKPNIKNISQFHVRGKGWYRKEDVKV